MSITYGNSYISGLNTFDLNIDYISTLQGTTNQVAVNGDFTNPKTGALQVSLPQSIAIDSNVSFNSVKLYDINSSNAFIIDNDTGVIGFYKGGSTTPSFTFSSDKFTTSKLRLSNGANLGYVLVSDANGDATWSNTYIKSISGTTNRVSVSNVNGDITLSTPQDTHTGASPTFYGITLTNGGTTNRVLCSDGFGNGFWNAIDGIDINGTINQIDVSTFNGVSTLSLPANISKSGLDPSFIFINTGVASSLRLALAGGVNYIQSGTDATSGTKPLAITSMFGGYEWMRYLTSGEIESTSFIPKVDSFYNLGTGSKRWSNLNAVNTTSSFIYSPFYQITDVPGAQWRMTFGDYRLNFIKQNNDSPNYTWPTTATVYFSQFGVKASEYTFQEDRLSRLFKAGSNVYLDYSDNDLLVRKINPSGGAVQYNPLTCRADGSTEIPTLKSNTISVAGTNTGFGEAVYVGGYDPSVLIRNSTGSPSILRLVLSGGQNYIQSAIDMTGGSIATLNFTSMFAGYTWMQLQSSGSTYINNLKLGTSMDCNGQNLSNVNIIYNSNGIRKFPSYSFTNYPTSGIYYDTTNNHISFSLSDSKALGIGSSGIFNIDGSASSPSITFMNDTNTGIYRKGNDNIAISTNGVERVNIDNSLNFTTNGADIPTPNTTSVGTRIVLYPQLSATDSNYSIGIEPNALWLNTASTTGSIKFYNSQALRCRINANGVNTDFITSLAGSYIGFDNKKLENINSIKFSTTNQSELNYYEEWNGNILFTKQTSGDYNRLDVNTNLPVRITRIGRQVNLFIPNAVNTFNCQASTYLASDISQIPSRFIFYNTGYTFLSNIGIMNDSGTTKNGLVSVWTDGSLWISANTTDTAHKFSGAGYNGIYTFSCSWSI